MYAQVTEYNALLIIMDSITDGYNMSKNKKQSFNLRPININPFSLKLSISALASITHRLSGLFLFLMLPFLLWAWQILVQTPTGAEQLGEWLSPITCKITLWVFLTAGIYHLFAGIRHILMDMHVLSESLMMGKISAWVVYGVTLLLAIWLAFRLFGGNA